MVPCGNPPLIELTNQKKPRGHNPCTCMWTNKVVPRHHHLLPSNPSSQHSRPPWQQLLRHHRLCTTPRELHCSVIVSHGCTSFTHLRLFETSHHHPHRNAPPRRPPLTHTTAAFLHHFSHGNHSPRRSFLTHQPPSNSIAARRSPAPSWANQ